MASQKLIQHLPLVILAAIVLFFLPSFRDLFAAWTIWDQSMSHGIPLALMFVYFLWKAAPWQNIERLPFERLCTAIVLLLCVLLWVLFYIVKIKILHQLLLMPIFIAALAMVFGLKSVWNYRVLLALPIYLIPVWDFINDYLVFLSSSVVAEMVRAVKLPALINGNNIQIPSGHIVIADGCSGLRYFIISLCLAHTISYMNGYKEKGLLSCLLLAALLGLITNWVRIFLLICIGYSTDMKSSLMEDHEAFGWVLFAIVSFVAIYFAPVVKAKKMDTGNLKEFSVAHMTKSVVLMLAVLLIAPITILSLNTINVKSYTPYAIDESYYHNSAHTMPLEITVPKSDVQLNIENIKGDVFVQVNEYMPQSMAEPLVPYISQTYNAETWAKVLSKTVLINNKPARLHILTSRTTEKTVMQVQWFVVGGYHALNMSQAKFYQVPALLKRKMYFTIFTLQAECESHDCANKEHELINESSKLKSE
jgi:exosortase